MRRLIERTTGLDIEQALKTLVLAPLKVEQALIARTRADLRRSEWGDEDDFHPGWVAHGLLPDRPWRTAGYGLGLMMDIASPHGFCIGHSGQGPDSVAAAYHFPDLDPPRTVAAFAPTDDRRPDHRRTRRARRGGAAALS